MVRCVVAGVGLSLLATACSMEGRLRRRGAFEVCEVTVPADGPSTVAFDGADLVKER